MVVHEPASEEKVSAVAETVQSEQIIESVPKQELLQTIEQAVSEAETDRSN